MERRKKYFLWIQVVAALGFLDSVWLLVIYLSSAASGLCTVNSFLNCEVANSSAYALWFGLPASVFGLLFYGVTMVLAFRGRFQKTTEPVREIAALWALSWVSVAATLYMAGISFLVLRVLCPFCAFLYLVSIGFLVAAWKLWSTLAERGWPVLLRSFRVWIRQPAVWTAAVVCLALLAGLRAYVAGRPRLSGTVNAVAAEAFRTKGAPEAKVTIAEFSDFQCPYCRLAAMLLQDVERELQGQVRLTYKFFPLDRSCNPNGGLHPQACAASYAAFCASLQNRFWEYHDLLFSSQVELPPEQLEAFARDVGLDPGKFAACMKDPRTKSAIQRDLAEGADMGVAGTPTIFINGRKFSGPLTLPTIKSAVAEASSAQ